MEPQQHLQRARQDEEVSPRGARHEQEQADDERRHYQLSFLFIEGRCEERPDLEDHVRRARDQAHNERKLECDEERIGGAGEIEPSAREVRRNRPHQQADHVEVFHHEPADDGAQQNRGQALQETPTQFLEMIEERHFTAMGGFGHAA